AVVIVVGGCKDFSVPEDPLVSPGQVDRIAGILGLSEEQKASARDLYGAYRGEFDLARGKLTDFYRRADRVHETTGDDAAVKAKERAKEKFDGHVAALRTRLIEDLHELVTPEQMAKWPLVERRLRRDELGEWGGLHGSGIDVAAVFEHIEKPGDRASRVAEIIDQYEDSIDRPLIEGRRVKGEWARREERLKKSAAAPDPAEQQRATTAFLSRLLTISQSMQRVNMRTVGELEDALPTARAAEFRDEFNGRAFGEMFTPGSFMTLVAEVERLDDLTAKQRERIDALREEYLGEVRRTGAVWAKAVVAWEQSKSVNAEGGEENKDEPPSVTSAKAAREALEPRYRKSVAGLLTPSQLEQFPGLDGREALGEIEF
ncbi:MAG TPA: hypothetical protein VG797_10385, partial [Phycisphaerales bacterium]|nr:hypothetical protein [Phycisphaerales bacterium]